MTFRGATLLDVISCLLTIRLSLAQGPQATPSKFALLIGIDHYDHPPANIAQPGPGVPLVGRDAPDMTYSVLKAPRKDVESFRQVLTTKFHFPDDRGHMEELLDEQATHDAIIAALQQILVDLPKKGDLVVLYVSSHGSLRIYPKGQGSGISPKIDGTEPLYNLLDNPNDLRHAEGTIVPYDWYKGVDDIFSRDLRHYYRLAVKNGVHVTAIFDSCHSGDLGRGLLSGKLIARDFEFDPREMRPNPYAMEELPTLPQDDPLTPVLILSAAQKDQLAIEVDDTQDPHGIFTRALVEVLNALPEDRPVSDVFSRLQVSMELAPDSIHQQPEIDTTSERRRQPIFGGEAASGKSTAAVLSVNEVLLDTGIGTDISPDSVFTTVPKNGETPIELRVTQPIGPGRFLAENQSPGRSVQANDNLQLKANATSAPVTATVVAINNVLLDIGIVADIGPGSIFAKLPQNGANQIELKVTQSLGLGRSIAQIQTQGGKVQPKDIVQLKAAVPWQRPDLLVYAGTSNPNLAAIQDAVAIVTAANLKLVPDPSRVPWAFHLYWDTSRWTLKAHSDPLFGVHHKPPASVDLGTKLTLNALHKVPAGNAVWFDPPLPSEEVQGLLKSPAGDGPHIAAKLTANRPGAMYVIGSRLTGSTISYAWFKRSDVDSEVQTPPWMGAGCSPGSSYPMHTEWIDQTSTDSTVAALNQYAVNLAKLNGWFLLQSSALSEHSQFPYTLALRQEDSSENVGQKGKTPTGYYDLYLTGHPRDDIKPQWVYVLNFDCQGGGGVVWPYDAKPPHISEIPRKFPADDAGGRVSEIRLPSEPFPLEVKPPLGTDTYILLTTSTPLRDYHALNFDRLVSKGATDNPLEELLDDTSAGMRLAGDPIPTDWGVWAMQVQSVPGATQPPQ